MEDKEQHIMSERTGQRWVGDPCGCSCWRGRNGEKVGRSLSLKEKNTKSWRSRMRSEGGTRDLEVVINGNEEGPGPDHLLILVNGIIGSANDWRFASQRMRSRLGRHVAIHCSVNNAALKTFDGVDVMGKRLANEVRDVIKKTPSATRISFLAHSLGGLVSRHAISQLYTRPLPPVLQSEDVGKGLMDGDGHRAVAGPSEATIGGLQAENFITLATPHLGCRGPEQLPFLLGIGSLEKVAPSLAHIFAGKTGKHLFLTDGSKQELPLLRKMVTDCKEGQFISSLGAFKRRVAYANVVNDHMVGWRTSSIRLKSEKPDENRMPVNNKYPHVIREEEPLPPLGEDLTVEILRREGKRGQDALEEEMVAALTQLAWHRVDVRFRGEKGSHQAHNLIQASESKKEAFRKYLEASGVLDSLTKVLVALYEEHDKPPIALEFIRKALGGPTLAEYEQLLQEKKNLLTKYDSLVIEHEECCRKLLELLPPPEINLDDVVPVEDCGIKLADPLPCPPPPSKPQSGLPLANSKSSEAPPSTNTKAPIVKAEKSKSPPTKK